VVRLRGNAVVLSLMAAGCFLSIPASAAVVAAAESCSMCHTGEEGSPPKLPIGGYERSAHAALACSSRHPGSDETPHAEKLPRVDCGNCHADAVLGLKSSTHGKSMLKRVRRRQ